MIRLAASTARPRTAVPPPVLVGDDEGHEGADELPYWPSLSSRRPPVGGTITAASPPMSGGAALGVLTNSIAAIGPAPHVAHESGGGGQGFTHRRHDALAQDVGTREEVSSSKASNTVGRRRGYGVTE